MNCCFLSKREAPLKAELSQLPVNSINRNLVTGPRTLRQGMW